MVRVGGGWDTLKNYLNKHDPCRSHLKGRQILPMYLSSYGDKYFVINICFHECKDC